MSAANGVQNRISRVNQHVDKVLAVIRGRLLEAIGQRTTGEIGFKIRLNQGGPQNVRTQVGVEYDILEEV